MKLVNRWFGIATAVLMGWSAEFSRAGTVNLGGASGWTAVMFGAGKDPHGDSQAGAADTDIIGDASHGSFYTAFDDNDTVTTADDTILFRLRIDNPTSTSNFGGVADVGLDVNGDGRVDIFVVVDGRNNGQTLRMMDPGTGENISPSTTTTSPLPSGWLPSNGVYPFSTANYLVAAVGSSNDPHWTGNSNLGNDSKSDAFVSWRLSMADLATVLAKPSPVDRRGAVGPRGSTGIAGFTKDTAVRYISFTQTQTGPINGDLNGVPRDYDKNGTFASLGTFTASMTASNPISASDAVIITKPVDANALINATEDNSFAVSGTATANGWVKLAITDTGAGSITVWAQANGSGAWSVTGQDLSALAEGTLTFTAQLVTASSGSTVVTGATSDSATATHDTVAPTVGVDALATSGKPVISGTSSGVPAGSTLTVKIDPNGDGTLADLVTFSAIAASGGAWSVNTGAVNPVSGTLSSAGFTAYAVVTAEGSDSAGNVGTGTAITKPVVNAQTSNNTRPIVTGTWGGTNGGTDTLAVSVNSVSYTTSNGLSISGNIWTLTIPSGSAALTSGSTYDVTATVTRSGTSVNDATSGELQIVSGPAVSITSNSSQPNSKPTVSGTSTVVSGFVTVRIDPNNDVTLTDAITYSVATNGSGNWSLDTSSATPLTGTYPLAGISGTMGILVTATDSNGAQATASQSLTVTIVTLSISSITSTATADSTATINNSDSYINKREDDAITVSGTSASAVGLTVTVTVSDGDSSTTDPSGTATITGDGTWSVTGLDLSALRDGYLTFGASVTGASASNTAFTHDATVPIVRFTTSSTIDKDAGTSPITGASDLVANSTISVSLDSNTGTATVQSNGTWSFSTTANMSGNASSTTVTATPSTDGTDTAGNKPAAAISKLFAVTANFTPTASSLIIGTIAGDNVITTSEASAVVISGTSALTGTVTVTITKADGTSVASTTATISGGAWSTSAQNLSAVTPNGPLVVTATLVSSSITYTDVAIPTLLLGTVGGGGTPALTITTVGDANLSATEDSSVTIAGTSSNVASGGTINLTISDTDGGTADVTGTATVDGSGAWTTSVNLSSQANGTLTVTASVTANSQTATTTASVQHDKVAPLITISAGPSASNSAPTINGTSDLSGGTSLTIAIDADANGSTDVSYSATAQSNGSWSLNTGAATPSSGSFPSGGLSASSKVTVSGADGAGNSTSIIATTITGITSDNGVSGTDFTTNDQTLSFSGKAEPSSSVAVSLGGTSLGTATADSNGLWTYNHSGTTLTAGSYTLTAVATKSTGVTATATQTVTVDTTAPAVAISSITSDNGASSTDYITNDATLVFVGTAEANSSVAVTLTSSSNATVFTTTVTASGGNWSVDRTGSSLSDGTYTLTVTASDSAGNSASATKTVVVDTSATLSITTNSKTSVTTPLITGTTDLETGRTITVVIGANTYTTTVQSGGNWSVTATTALSGTVTITASGTDTAGNSVTASKSLTIDPVAPTVTVTEPIGDGNLSTTEDTAVVIQGTSTAVPSGSTLQVTITDGSITINDSTTVASNGSWSLAALSFRSMANGVITVTATYTDDSGTAYSDTATVLHDKAGTATIDSITSDTGVISDFITSDQTLVFAGSASANGSVVLTLTSGAQVFSTTLTANSSGVWTYDYTGSTLAAGSYTLQAVSGATATQTIVIDTAAPGGPVSVTSQTTANTKPTIAGTATLVSGESLTVSVNGVTYTSGDGNLTLTGTNWSLVIPAANALTPATVAAGGFNGIYSVTATIKDAAGNVLNDSTSSELTIQDITAPVIDLAPGNGSSVNYSATSANGGAVSLDDNSSAVTVTEASDKLNSITITVGGLLNDTSEKLIFGSTTVQANGGSGTQSDITVGGVRINVTYAGSVFTIQKYNYTALTAAEAQALLRDLQY
jgi:hypothetical protein